MVANIKTFTTITIDHEVKSIAQAYLRRENKSLSRYIQECLEEYIKEKEVKNV